jgi:hypothetical protein
MSKREGVALLLGGMSPAELVAKRKAKMSGAPAPAPKAPADEKESDDTEGSRAAAVSAAHQLAAALGVEIKDEDAFIQAFADLQESCPNCSKYEPEE